MTTSDPEAAFLDLPAGSADLEAERSVLGAMMLSRAAILDVEGTVKAEDFYVWAHERIFAAITWLHSKGQPVDPVIVQNALDRAGDLKRILVTHGNDYLYALVAAVPAVSNAGFYARTVLEKSALRQLTETGTRMVVLGQSADTAVVDVYAAAQTVLDRAKVRLHGAGPLGTTGDALDAAIDGIEDGSGAGLNTGFVDLDHLTGGLRGMTVLAGATSSGKSAAGQQIAIYAALHGAAVVVNTIEMTSQEWWTRAFSQLGGVDLSRLIRGGKALSEEEWHSIARARSRLGECLIHVDDRPDVTPADVVAGAGAYFRKVGREPGLVVVDYAQIVKPPPLHKQANREQQVAAISWAFKLGSKTLGCPLLVLSQLSKEHIKAGRKPRVDDLRESASLGHDADAVALLHPHPKFPGVTEVGIDKNRHGPRGWFPMDWDGAHVRLRNMSMQEQMALTPPPVPDTALIDNRRPQGNPGADRAAGNDD